jgi:hypothetical protein
MSVQSDDDVAMTAVRHFCAKRLQHRVREPWVNVAAHRVGKNPMQGGALLVVHADRSSLDFGANGAAAGVPSMIHIKMV